MKRRRLVARSMIGVMTVSSPGILPRILSGRRGDANRRHCIARAETAIIRGRFKGTVTMPNGKPTIAFIGFGEAGQAIAAGLREAGVETMAAWDILFPQAAGENLKRAAEAAGVGCANSAADAVRGTDVIISAVTAASSVDAAQAVKAHLAGTPYFLDINSVSPGRKQDTAKLLGAAGRYVDVAVLAPIYPARHQTPMLLAGPHAATIAPVLVALGMRVSVAGAETGAAAAIKMVRSVMIKGIEALTLECFLADSRAGVIDEVAASMKNNYPGLDWAKIVPYNLERMANHGERRAAEMEEVADTLRELGVEPLMTSATVKRQREMGQIGRQQSVRGTLDKDRAAMLGAISAAARDRH
jgi:3-hydroxyisobutyrate dehydrogenase-like beta-hydroxyacid dehydrogenase